MEQRKEAFLRVLQCLDHDSDNGRFVDNFTTWLNDYYATLSPDTRKLAVKVFTLAGEIHESPELLLCFRLRIFRLLFVTMLELNVAKDYYPTTRFEARLYAQYWVSKNKDAFSGGSGGSGLFGMFMRRNTRVAETNNFAVSLMEEPILTITGIMSHGTGEQKQKALEGLVAGNLKAADVEYLDIPDYDVIDVKELALSHGAPWYRHMCNIQEKIWIPKVDPTFMRDPLHAGLLLEHKV